MTKMVTAEEAVPAKAQHRTPCGDCPWRRNAINGWLGGATADDWIDLAHSDHLESCHALTGVQCAGLAIYRANVCKSPRDPEALRLPADRVAVFASPSEFKEHHSLKGKKRD